MNILFTYPSAAIGTLYNLPAVEDNREIAPEDWRVMNLEDILSLFDFYGGESVTGGHLKSLTTWTAPNTGATNSDGFNALPVGIRDETGTYSGKLTQTTFWIK